MTGEVIIHTDFTPGSGGPRRVVSTQPPMKGSEMTLKNKI